MEDDIVRGVENGGQGRERGQPEDPPCSQNRGVMAADDLLCSRNARPPKALVGRAQ